MNKKNESTIQNLKSKIPLIVFGSTTLVIVSTSAVAALNLGGISSIVNTVGGVTGITTSVLDKVGVDTRSLKDVTGAIGTTHQTLGEVNDYISQLQAFYSTIVGGNLWGIIEGVETVVGLLGIPDPDATDRALNGHLSSDPTSAGHKDAETANETLNRQIAHGITASVLGTAGQKRLGVLQNQADTLTGQAWQSLEAATSKNVTQDVLKETAKIQATQAQLQRLQSAQLLDLQVGQAAGNLMLEDISGAIAQINYAREQEQDRQAFLMVKEGNSVFIPSLKLGQATE